MEPRRREATTRRTVPRPTSRPSVRLVDWLEDDGDELVAEFDRLYVPRNDGRWLRRNALVAAGNVGTPRSRRRRAVRRVRRSHPVGDGELGARANGGTAGDDREPRFRSPRRPRARGSKPGRRVCRRSPRRSRKAGSNVTLVGRWSSWSRSHVAESSGSSPTLRLHPSASSRSIAVELVRDVVAAARLRGAAVELRVGRTSPVRPRRSFPAQAGSRQSHRQRARARRDGRARLGCRRRRHHDPDRGLGHWPRDPVGRAGADLRGASPTRSGARRGLRTGPRALSRYRRGARRLVVGHVVARCGDDVHALAAVARV